MPWLILCAHLMQMGGVLERYWHSKAQQKCKHDIMACSASQLLTPYSEPYNFIFFSFFLPWPIKLSKLWEIWQNFEFPLYLLVLHIWTISWNGPFAKIFANRFLKLFFWILFARATASCPTRGRMIWKCWIYIQYTTLTMVYLDL
jgi:hypothetical protein